MYGHDAEKPRPSLYHKVWYNSTSYIGMDEVLAHYACTFEISDLNFHFQ